MRVDGRTVLVCSCDGTAPIDGAALARALGGDGRIEPAQQLCRRELARFDQALAAGGPVTVACAQEAPLFAERAAEIAPGADLRAVDVRDRALWSDEAAAATPKLAALIAEAAEAVRPAEALTLRSGGVCLVYGRDEAAIEAAALLAGRLDVTVLLARPGAVIPPRSTTFPIVKGVIRAASGHLGAFRLTVDDFAHPAPSSRGALEFGPGQNGALSECDVIVDLSGGAPLLTGGTRRDGYLRADPRDPAAVLRAVLAAGDLVGEFEKPRHVAFRSELCAHSRARKTGCTRCLDLCPTGAITPGRESVALDPYVCAGCGACAAVCPTGAASYAAPTADALLRRVRALLTTYLDAGGGAPALLVYDQRRGAELVHALGRHGSGLPARVLPLEVGEVTALGPELALGAFAYGAAELIVLATADRREELGGLAQTLGLAETAMSGLGHGEGRARLAEVDDPDALGALLRALPRRDGIAAPSRFLPLGAKRALAWLALRHLHAAAATPPDVLPLAAGAPFGAIAVDQAACTLCLACVPACPTGALSDDPDRPKLSFTAEACVQCGLCRATCPENAITLVPQLDFRDAARSPQTMREEEPWACPRCGRPFATKSGIARIKEKLAGRHWMFADPAAIARLELCGDCRVVAVAESGADPFAGAPRPAPVTAEDHLRARAIADAARREPEGNA